MTAGTLVAHLLAGLGVLLVTASACAALLPRSTRGRLHFLTPVTSLGAPLVGLGLAVDTGWHLATAAILVTVAVVTVTGPALAAATGRVSALRDGLVRQESPR